MFRAMGGFVFSGLLGWHLVILMVLWFIPFVLWLIAVIQVATAKAPAGPTVGWLLLVTFAPVVGPILWFAIGLRSIGDPPAPPQSD